MTTTKKKPVQKTDKMKELAKLQKQIKKLEAEVKKEREILKIKPTEEEIKNLKQTLKIYHNLRERSYYVDYKLGPEVTITFEYNFENTSVPDTSKEEIYYYIIGASSNHRLISSFICNDYIDAPDLEDNKEIQNLIKQSVDYIEFEQIFNSLQKMISDMSKKYDDFYWEDYL